MNLHEGLGKRNPQQVAGEQFRFVFNMAKLALSKLLAAKEKLALASCNEKSLLQRFE